MAEQQEIVSPEVQQDTPEQQPQDAGGQPAPSPARKLYDQLNKSQLYTKSFDEFQQQFSKPEMIDKLYQNLNGAKLYTKSKDEFYNQFFQSQKPSYQTQLSADEEQKYQQWKQKLPGDLKNDNDYDLRGQYKADPNVAPSERMHFTDEFKKPNHITFSDQSKYNDPANGVVGGHWEGDDNSGTFYASGQNVKNAGGLDKLQQYFKQYEPGYRVVAPGPDGNPQSPENQISHTSLQDIRHLNDLANQPVRSLPTTAEPMTGGTTYNQEDVARNKGYQDRYDKSVNDLAGSWGTDPTATKQTLQDFPDVQDENTLKKYTGLYKDNPVNYQRLKDGTDIRKAIINSGDPDAHNDAHVINNLFAPSQGDTYEGLQNNIAMSQEILSKHGLGQQYAEKLKNVYSPLINTLQPGLLLQYENSDDKKLGLTDFQYAGLETEKMFQPGKYSQDMAIIKHNRGLDEGAQPVPIPQGKEGYAYDRGVENVLYSLENQGRQNTSQYISQRTAEIGPQINDLVSKYQQWINSSDDPLLQQHFQQEFHNDPLLQEAAKLSDGQQSIDYAKTEDQRKFPLNYGDQVTRLVKDAMSSTNGIMGVASKQVALGAGEANSNSMRFIYNTFVNLLASDQYKAKNAAQNIGHQALTELAGYEGSAFSMQQSPLVIDPKIQSMIQAIGQNSSLSDEEKNKQSTELILAYPDAIKVNPAGGQKNITGKAVIYSAANTIGQILGIADQSLLMGGLMGDASKASQMANAVTPMYASTQNQLYEQALARGDEKPLLSSHLDAAIISLASLINPDIKVVKGMVGAETGIGKLIAGVDETTWNKVLSTNTPLVDRMKGATVATAKQLGLANLQYGLIVPTAQYVVHKNVLNEDPNLGDMLTDGLIQTNISMALPALFHGAWGAVNATKVNPMQKMALVETGLHPKEHTELIDQLVEKGQVTPDRADQIKDVIKMAGHILEHTDGVKSDGTPMTETEVSDLTYQLVRKKVLEGKLKNAPDPQKPAIEQRINEIDQSVADLHTSEADKQKSTLNQLLTENMGRIAEKIPTMEGQVRESIKRNEPEQVFKEIYDQATQTTNVDGKEISSRAATEETFGKALVKKAFELHKQKTTSDEKTANDAQAGGRPGQITETPPEGAGSETTGLVAGAPSFISFENEAQKDFASGNKKRGYALKHNADGSIIASVLKEGKQEVQSGTEVELNAAEKKELKRIDADKELGNIDGVEYGNRKRALMEKVFQRHLDENAAPKPAAPSLQPNSDKIKLADAFRTWNLGDMEGKPEDEAAKKHIEGVVQAWDKHPAGETGGETFGQFIGRVIPAFDKALKEEPNNAAIVTHSSVLKAMRVWDEMGRPDVDNLTPEEKKTFADKYNQTETQNGDLETFKGDNGDIHVIRHGQTEDNAKNNFRSGDTPLTQKGIGDAQAVAQELKDKTGGDVPKIITSDLPRTIRTSNIISDALQEHTAGKMGPHPVGDQGAGGGGEGEGVGSGQQGEAPPGETGGTGEGQEPPGAVGGQKVVSGEPSQTGIAERVKKEREAAAGVQAPEPGTGLSVEAGVERGRKLLREGADPEKILEEYSEKKKGLIADDVSVVRARLEQLAKATDAAIEKYGDASKEADAARKAESDWAARIQPMQTDWSEIGRRQQGSTDLDTGSVTSLKRGFQEQSGKPVTPQQAEVAKNLHAKIKEQETTISDLQQKLDTIHNANQPKTSSSFSDKAKSAADIFRKLKTKEFTFKDKYGNDVPIQKMGISWNDVVEIGAKAIEKTGKIADGIAAIIEKVKSEDWYKGLDKDDKDRFQKELEDHYTGIADKKTASRIKALEKELEDLQAGKVKNKTERTPTAREQELKDQIFEAKQNLGLIKPKGAPQPKTPIAKPTIDIASHFVDKKDNDFSQDESKAIWEHTKKVIESGKTDFHDVISQVSMDTGLSAEQVNRAISQPKGAKAVTDGMYAAMYRRNQIVQQARAWVKSADQSATKKFWKMVIAGPAAIVTALHGSVAPITHAGADLYRPSNWKSYFNFMLNSYKFSFGGLTDKGKATYEKAMGDLVHDPMFPMAKRAGLKIDPTDLSGDDYSKYQGVFRKLSKMGERGFNAMKLYRLEQFKQKYNSLSDQAKSNPDVLKAIAHMANLSSGTTDAEIPENSDLVFFAPKLVTSQYQRIFSEPAKAASTFANWNKATDAQKLQAKMVARHAGEMMGTYMGFLAANAAILSMTGSNQKINFTNPLDPDWMKFKMKGKTVDASGGMNSALRFIGSIVEEGARANGIVKTPEKSKPGETEGRKFLQQLTNKLSPLAGDVVEGLSGTDGGGNSLPWSSVKPPAGKEKLGWSEYFESKSPIFLAEGFKAFHDAAKEQGMPKATLDNYLEGLLIGTLAGTTGAKIGPDVSKKPTGRTPRGETPQ